MFYRFNLLVAGDLSEGLLGKLFGDKAYIYKELYNKLYARNLRLFTGIRRDMKNHLLEIEDKFFMRKRSIIESVFNVLKNNMKGVFIKLCHFKNHLPNFSLSGK